MSIAQASLSVTAGTQYTQYVGSAQTVGAVVVLNESPYGLMVSSGASSQWIAAQTADLVACDSAGFNGSLTITTDSYLNNATEAPSFLVYFTTFSPGEPIRGTYPAPLMRLASGNLSVGNNAAVTIEQDLLTPFVYAGIAPSFTGFNLYSTTAGIAFLRQSDSSLLRQAVATYAVNISNISATLYHDLNPDGTFSLNTSHSTQPNYLTIATIVTNGSGQITSVTDTRQMSTTVLSGMTNTAGAPGVSLYNLHVFKNIQADNQVSVQGTIQETSGSTGKGYQQYIGGNDELLFMPTGSTTAQGVVFYGWFTGSPGVALPLFSIGATANVGAAYVDTAGVLHATAPLTLIGGNQESGRLYFQFYSVVASAMGGYAVNFKTNMTNTPSSITATVAGSLNFASLTIDHITTQGFNFTITATLGANNETYWYGSYTTVGNCLLGINAAAQTFDHHCEACGQVNAAQPFAALQVSQARGVALSFICPHCGATEAFNCDLTAADEADTTPQGTGQYQTTRGAQAALIRALQTALGLPVLP